ncbi:hypothetical protein Pfo_016354 [Paulownia fortunei]|nr:hypothetical protein Pfo_016354 [Paulownia fortunei]
MGRIGPNATSLKLEKANVPDAPVLKCLRPCLIPIKLATRQSQNSYPQNHIEHKERASVFNIEWQVESKVKEPFSSRSLSLLSLVVGVVVKGVQVFYQEPVLPLVAESIVSFPLASEAVLTSVN